MVSSIIRKLKDFVELKFEDSEAKKTLIGGIMLKFGL